MNQHNLLGVTIATISWIGVLLSNIPPETRAQRPAGMPLPAHEPRSNSSQPAKGLAWEGTLVRLLSTRDSVWFTSVLMNHSDRRFHYEPNPVPVHPRLVLTPKGRGEKVLPLDHEPGPQTHSINRSPAPGDKFHEFRVDLRAYFGRLEPGMYRVQVVWPAGSLKLRGLPSYRPVELKSSEIEFEIRKAPPDDGLSELIPAYRMMERDEPMALFTEGDVSTATFTSRFSNPIHFQYETQYDENGNALPAKPPLRAHLILQRWHPTEKWQIDNAWTPIDRNLPRQPNMPYYTLNPGESVRIKLPDWMINGDGIYSYYLHVYSGGVPASQAKGPHLLGQVTSTPFVVDSLDARR